MKSKIDEAVSVLNQGGIIIFPTDTAFGIGCRVDKPESVKRLFQIRRRPLNQAMPVLVASKLMALTYFSSPSTIVRQLMDKYWPGALTIISQAKKDLQYSPICGKTEFIGLRMPDHQIPLAIIARAGVPILGPSANFHGGKTPYKLADLDQELVRQVDLVIPGECVTGNVSTVVDCSKVPYKIIRQGAVKL